MPGYVNCTPRYVAVNEYNNKLNGTIGVVATCLGASNVQNKKKNNLMTFSAAFSKTMVDPLRMAAVILVLLVTLLPMLAVGATAVPSGSSESQAEIITAPVRIDGIILFHVRGVSAYPAQRRAREIAARIEQLAADDKFNTEQLQLSEQEGETAILAGDLLILRVFDADAQLENLERKLLATTYLTRIQEAITDYRQARGFTILVRHALYIVLATVALLLFIWLVRRLMRFTKAFLERRMRSHLEGLESKSMKLVRAKQMGDVLHGVVRLLWLATFVFVGLWYLQFVLAQLPWTRQFGDQLLTLLLDPLRTLGRGFVDSIPNVAFLVILILITRYLLKVMRLFFSGLVSGRIKLESFDSEWAWPTYRLVRLLVIVFALVVAFPYIPGSSSDAFKGVSVFLGIVFSLGSSSVIANIIAGYSITYRRAFKLGDRIQVGDQIGDVVESGVLVTHLRTVKNEDVVVPNSLILNSSIVNFSTLAREGKLILHTTVGIGYETPWRQVEAMLLQAANQTEGVQSEPAPYVLQKALGDFCITYEINVYCDNAQMMNKIYTVLHRNILDVFNEYGVQIMTPAYESDPPVAKVVPKDQWFASPAKPAGK